VNPSDVRGPGIWTVNLSLGKTFRITESVHVELRGEALNAFNHANYNNPGTLNILSPDFGRITGDAGPRSGQVFARLTF
jgi:hypothetical protein